MVLADTIHKLAGTRRGRELRLIDEYRKLTHRCASDKPLTDRELQQLENVLAKLGVNDVAFQGDVNAIRRRAELEQQIDAVDRDTLYERRKELLFCTSADEQVRRRQELQQFEADLQAKYREVEKELEMHDKDKCELESLVRENPRVFAGKNRSLF